VENNSKNGASESGGKTLELGGMRKWNFWREIVEVGEGELVKGHLRRVAAGTFNSIKAQTMHKNGGGLEAGKAEVKIEKKTTQKWTKDFYIFSGMKSILVPGPFFCLEFTQEITKSLGMRNTIGKPKVLFTM
jgi:hypothetical protein